MRHRVFGEVESVEVIREDGERYILAEGSAPGAPIRIDPSADAQRLIDALERTLPVQDNAFRQKPNPKQTGLDELGGVPSASEPSDGSVWDAVDPEVEAGTIPLVEPELEPGETFNEADPHKW